MFNRKTQINSVQPDEQKIVSTKNSWLKDKKVIGTIIMIIAIAFLFFGFLKVPFFSTIHGYTIGMMFG